MKAILDFFVKMWMCQTIYPEDILEIKRDDLFLYNSIIKKKFGIDIFIFKNNKELTKRLNLAIEKHKNIRAINKRHDEKRKHIFVCFFNYLNTLYKAYQLKQLISQSINDLKAKGLNFVFSHFFKSKKGKIKLLSFSPKIFIILNNSN